MGGCDKEESHEQSHELRFTPISTTMTTMDVFDRVQDPESGVVRANGEIIKWYADINVFGEITCLLAINIDTLVFAASTSTLMTISLCRTNFANA